MYIMIVSRGYPTKKYPRNGLFEFDQARALVQAGHKVVFAAIDTRSLRRWRKWWHNSEVSNGIHVESISLPCGRIHRPTRQAVSVLALDYLYKTIEKKFGKPDIIHSHFWGIGEVTLKALKKSGVPIVHTEHSSWLNTEEIDAKTARTAEYVFSNADGLIAVSEPFKERLEKQFRAEFFCIPNAVDTDKFRSAIVCEPTEGFKIISVGNLVPNKGMDTLIIAFYEVFAHKQGTHLYIVGEGPERGRLKRLIDVSGTSGQVQLLGSLNRNEIAKKMCECHCFALASRGETFGVAYIEAMAAGLPVVATKCGGPENFVNDTNGILVDIDDIGALGNALQYMQDNYRKFDRIDVSKRASACFSPERLAEKLLEVYKKTIC